MASLSFQDFELNPDQRRLMVRGQAAHIGARAYDLLMALVERSDRVVSKDELLDVVWPKLVVEENNLQVHIHALRKMLGPTAITTVPGRGYRFTAERTQAAGAPRIERRRATTPPAEELSTTRKLDAQPGNLPDYLPELYGREDAVRAVCGLLETERLVTISGAGGIGKTRLAQTVSNELRQHYPHGVWMIELAWVNDASLLESLVAQALGIMLPGHKAALDELADALRSQSVLLVLDNCEHVIDAVGTLAFQLLRTAPSLRMLVTSQELLRVAGEQVYKLAPLAIPVERDLQRAAEFGAVRLFVERARSLDRRFELNERNVDAVIDICAQLDGIPLAIELAAARIPLLGVYGVLDRLGERFRMLTGGARVSLRRHQTLRAALDWSHHLLKPDEQKVFRRLGVFSGGFVVDGAQLVASDDGINEWAVLDHLSTLVDKSLVLVDDGERPRYRLLESARAYALERLAEAGETDTLLRRHAHATGTLCERAVRSRDIDWLWAEMNNVRAAYAWARGDEGDDTLAVSLTTSSSMVLAVAGLVSEGMQRLLEVEPLVTTATPPALAAQYWQWLGRGGIDGRLPTSRCIEALQRAEAMFRSLHNVRHLHACLRMRAEALVASEDLAGARAALHEAQGLESNGCTATDRLRRLRVQGLLCVAEARHEEALAMYGMAYDMAVSAQAERYVLILLADMAAVHLKMGQAAQAAEQYRALAEKARHRRSQGLTLAHALAGLMAALITQQQLAEATTAGGEALLPLRRCGIFVAHCDIYAWLMACHGRLQIAAQLLGAADAFHQNSETARDAVKGRARQEVIDLLATNDIAGQTQLWMLEGAAATEEALAVMVDAALVATRALPAFSGAGDPAAHTEPRRADA
jgi:predicted ATPase/DNA-binding winged helix-turn-helix (wHTH) protein